MTNDNTKHTPGPATPLCDCGCWSEHMAEAHLIAAAPELLEACKAVLPIVRNSAVSGHYGDKLAIAIAKAEGRS